MNLNKIKLKLRKIKNLSNNSVLSYQQIKQIIEDRINQKSSIIKFDWSIVGLENRLPYSGFRSKIEIDYNNQTMKVIYADVDRISKAYDKLKSKANPENTRFDDFVVFDLKDVDKLVYFLVEKFDNIDYIN